MDAEGGSEARGGPPDLAELGQGRDALALLQRVQGHISAGRVIGLGLDSSGRQVSDHLEVQERRVALLGRGLEGRLVHLGQGLAAHLLSHNLLAVVEYKVQDSLVDLVQALRHIRVIDAQGQVGAGHLARVLVSEGAQAEGSLEGRELQHQLAPRLVVQIDHLATLGVFAHIAELDVGDREVGNLGD